MELMHEFNFYIQLDANTSSPLDRPMGRVALSLLGQFQSGPTHTCSYLMQVGG